MKRVALNLYGMREALDTYCLALLALALDNLKETEKVAELNAVLAGRMREEGWFEGGKDTITRSGVQER